MRTGRPTARFPFPAAVLAADAAKARPTASCTSTFGPMSTHAIRSRRRNAKASATAPFSIALASSEERSFRCASGATGGSGSKGACCTACASAPGSRSILRRCPARRSCPPRSPRHTSFSQALRAPSRAGHAAADAAFRRKPRAPHAGSLRSTRRCGSRSTCCNVLARQTRRSAFATPWRMRAACGAVRRRAWRRCRPRRHLRRRRCIADKCRRSRQRHGGKNPPRIGKHRPFSRCKDIAEHGCERARRKVHDQAAALRRRQAAVGDDHACVGKQRVDSGIRSGQRGTEVTILRQSRRL